jgi:hypothetical protein
MNEQAPPASNGHRMPPAKGAKARPDAFAVSPAIGPLPAIDVSPSPNQATGSGLLWHARSGRYARQAAGPSPTGRAATASTLRWPGSAGGGDMALPAQSNLGHGL